jgi:molybdopterin-containing oxidoreductase family membrane subunit
MFEKGFRGNAAYWSWLAFLGVIIAIGAACYVRQFNVGLAETGMSRDISWGLYIAQFTFLVGVAAGGLMLVLPFYIHNYKAFAKITILGEFLAISAVVMCLLFVMVDIGQPTRAFNMILHPTPHSMLFWDMVVLLGYLGLNCLCGWVILTSERKEVRPPKWIYFFVYLSIPWAVSIHTVTGMLYCGLPARDGFLSAIIAPRFLASAFAAGPAVVVIACVIMKRIANFDAGKTALNKVSTIIIYATLINTFFVLMEVFVGYYSQKPGELMGLRYQYFGLYENGHLINQLVPLTWTSVFFNFAGLGVLGYLKIKKSVDEWWLAIGCFMIFLALYIDKGYNFVIGGFVPSPLDTITTYHPKPVEIGICLGIWAVGFFMVTVLYKIAVSVEHEVE